MQPNAFSFFQELDFLGHSISKNRISRDKFKIIDKISPPKNRKSLQRLLGIVQYFRRFIRGFSQKMFHMRQLLKADTPFVWSAECDKELQYIKQTLLSDPVLVPLNPNKDVVILTDASYLGFGYIILQKDDNDQLRVIYYGGNALTAAPANYCPADLELSSLVLALKGIDWFAQHRKITVYTDNARVLFFQKWNPLSQRQKRMVTYLQQFRLDLHYLKGVRNVSADCCCFDDMSFDQRVELQQEVNEEEFIVAVGLPANSKLQNVTGTALETAMQEPLIIVPVGEQTCEQNRQQAQSIVDGQIDREEEIVGKVNVRQMATARGDLSRPPADAIDGPVNGQGQPALQQQLAGRSADSDLKDGATTRQSVCLSVRHTLALSQNDSSYDHGVFAGG